jgi:peptidoglycan hydrolase-like protein with peptidoglycan-binding domain
MKIVISSGHGKYVRGAEGILDEVDEARMVVEQAALVLRNFGEQVTTYHDDVSTSQDENLNRIVDFHNAQGPHDLDVSVHFNAYLPDGQTTNDPKGTECWYKTQDDLAAEVASSIAIASGLIDRGKKHTDDLFFLNNTSEPAILVEVCFVDSSADAGIYSARFGDICEAMALAMVGEEAGGRPPIERPPPPIGEPPPERPHWPGRPENVPLDERPTLRQGDEGADVLDMQRMIPRFSGEFDGDFGPTTFDNVVRYQRSRGLDPVDGICGGDTWEALYRHALPVAPPAPPPGALSAQEQIDVMEIANESDIADYSWEDRGVAPTGFTQGMALSFAQTLKKLWAEHPAALEMAKARTDSDKDVLNVYREEFDDLDMGNERAGVDTLRHLYAFMLGSGMRESSGQHCCGRDQSASNTDSDTCEAGAFQTSYNASNASDPEFDQLMDQFIAGLHPGYLEAWSEGVSCSSSDWQSYGSGRGFEFQELCKNQPAFSAETHALTLRNLCNHYGPVIRGEVELVGDADAMLREVQEYMELSEVA